MKIFILDTETDGLQATQFWCIVLKEFKQNNYFIFVNDSFVDRIQGYNVAPLSKFKEWFEENIPDGTRIVSHNGIDFDAYWTKKLLGVDLLHPRISFRDTYVLSRLANPVRKGGHSVENLGSYFGLNKVNIADEDWGKFDPIMVERCIADVNIQEKIYDYLREKELRGFSLKSIDVEHDAQKIISKQRRDGVYINPQRLHELFSETKRHYERLAEEITSKFKPKPQPVKEYNPRRTKNGQWALRSFGSDYDAADIGGDFTSIRFVPFNLNSSSQRIQRLLDLGWTPTEFTEAGNPKFTEDSLKNLPPDAPQEVRLIGEYLMTFSRHGLTKQILEGVDRKDYLHGYVNTLGTNTHRMSSNSPNLQNIPRPSKERGLAGGWGYECRDLFQTEFPYRNVLVDCDAAGIQLRALAHYCDNPEYISMVSDPNTDIHKIHAEVLQCSRPVAKTFIYAFLMGAGVKKLAWVLGGNDAKKGKELLDLFYERFPFLREFKNRLDKEVARGYHVALDGRLIRLNPEMPHAAMAVALQSFEAIVMKRAGKLYQDTLDKEGIWYVQRLMVHDEFLVETAREYGSEVGKCIANSIAEAGVDLGSKCPLAGEYHVGKTWAEVH